MDTFGQFFSSFDFLNRIFGYRKQDRDKIIREVVADVAYYRSRRDLAQIDGLYDNINITEQYYEDEPIDDADERRAIEKGEIEENPSEDRIEKWKREIEAEMKETDKYVESSDKVWIEVFSGDEMISDKYKSELIYDDVCL